MHFLFDRLSFFLTTVSLELGSSKGVEKLDVFLHVRFSTYNLMDQDIQNFIWNYNLLYEITNFEFALTMIIMSVMCFYRGRLSLLKNKREGWIKIQSHAIPYCVVLCILTTIIRQKYLQV